MEVLPLLKWMVSLGREAWQGISKRQADRPGKELVQRFVRIFEAQDVKRIEIPRVLTPQWNFKASQVLDDNALLDLLDGHLLDHVCERFGVARAWLDTGDGTKVYPRNCVYSDLSRFIKMLQDLRAIHQELEMIVVKATDNNLDGKAIADDIVFFLRGRVSELDGRTLVRDYLIDDVWPWNHGKARIQLKAACLIAWQFHLVPACYSVDPKQISRFVDGELLAGELLSARQGARWHLDDYIFTDGESYSLKDPEEAIVVPRSLAESGLLDRLAEAGVGEIRVPCATSNRAAVPLLFI